MAEINFPLRVVAKGSLLVPAFGQAKTLALPTRAAGEAWLISAGVPFAWSGGGDTVNFTFNVGNLNIAFYNDGVAANWVLLMQNQNGSDVTVDWAVMGVLAT